MSHYLLTVSAINVGFGALVAVAMFATGMPNPLLWGVMVGILNYIPFLGHTVSAIVIAVVALLSFDEFGWKSLEEAAGRDSETVEQLLAHALAYFDTELPATRSGMFAPRFNPAASGLPREVVLEVPADRWRRLEDEAGRQGVALAQLLEHAALFYLADADAGRVAERILRDAESE